MTVRLGPAWLVNFWARPLRPEPLALFRILLGTTVFCSLLLSLQASLDRYLGPDGLCPAEDLDGWFQDTGRFSPLVGPTNLPIFEALLSADQKAGWAAWGQQLSTVRLFFGLWLGAIFCFTIGLGTRCATIAAWALTVTFHNRMSWVLNGGDDLFRTAFFYLMLAPAGAAWSVDNWLFKRSARLVPAWPVRLMQIQLCLIYLATGAVKLHEDWFRGVAVYWVLNDVAVARWPYCRFPVPLFLCQVASWGTLLFEIGFPVLVLFARIRTWLLLAGIGLHAGIWLTTEVGWFSPITLCWYALFLSPSAAEHGLRLLTGQWHTPVIKCPTVPIHPAGDV